MQQHLKVNEVCKQTLKRLETCVSYYLKEGTKL